VYGPLLEGWGQFREGSPDIIYYMTYSTRIIAPDQLGHTLNNVPRQNNNNNNNIYSNNNNHN